MTCGDLKYMRLLDCFSSLVIGQEKNRLLEWSHTLHKIGKYCDRR